MAYKIGIKIVTKNFLDKTKNKNYLNYKENMLPPFYNITFNLLGFYENEYNSLQSLIVKNKGIILPNSRIENSDIIIINSNYILNDEEIDFIRKFKFKITTEKWIEKCIKQSKYIQLNKDDLYPIGKLSISYFYNNLVKNFFYVKEKKKINLNNLNNLFKNKIFYIAKVYEDLSYNYLIDIINKTGGKVNEIITQNTNYIICKKEEDIKININNCFNEPLPKILIFNFIFDSISKGKIIEDKNYIYYSPKKRKNIYEIEYLTMDESLDNIIKEKKYNDNIKILSNIFKEESFSICKETYTDNEISLIKRKIIENSGIYIDNLLEKIKELDSKNNLFNREILNINNYNHFYLICNDGFKDYLSILLDYKTELFENKNVNLLIVSHRYINLCIEENCLISFNNKFCIYPFDFKVPIKFFQKINFYIPEIYYERENIKEIENLILILGGKTGLNQNTTHVLVPKEIKSFEYEKISEISNNQNLKIIKDDWIIDLISGESKFIFNNQFDIKYEGKIIND